jgi:predicted dehydrogenase
MSLRIALIGAGVMGRQHAEQLARSPEAELVAICDPYSTDLASAQGVRQFADHRAMLEQMQFDGVIIANPNDAHVSTALDCLAAGIPALLEKPVATSLEEVRRLVQAESAGAVPLLIGHHRRHNPIIQKAKEIIDSGQLGVLTTFTGLWQSQKAQAYFDVPWRRQPGAGVMLINLVHDLDLMRYLGGEVATVQALVSHAARNLEVEDTAAMLLQFASGALGTLTGSDACATPWSWDQSSGENPAFAQQPDQPCYLIGGTHGSLSIPQLSVWRYGDTKGWNAPLHERREPPEGALALANQLSHFLQVIRRKAKPLITAADAARTLALVEAAGEAARQRCVIELGNDLSFRTLLATGHP